MKKIIITGAAGFIGFHTARRLLADGWTVVGVDNLSPYYDVRMKRARLDILRAFPAFTFAELDLAQYEPFLALCTKEQPDEILHLAAQAGVRYSLVNPRAYADANYLGTLNVFEAARQTNRARVIYASSSSVYGLNEKQPFAESDRVDRPISLYAASKRANELLAHAYHHLFGIEMVGLRFFTVYGTWGRPDLALFKFAKRMLRGEPIDLYNSGEMKRSFTHIDDVVAGIVAILARMPARRNDIYNLGGDEAVSLGRFVELIERELGVTAQKNLMPLQPGDVPETVADCSLAARELGYHPHTNIEAGIREFAAWFKEHRDFALALTEPQQ